MKPCPNCSQTVPLTNAFCDLCGHRFSVEPETESRSLSIGRENVDVLIDDDSGQVSRHHADVIESADGQLFLVDRASTNGSFVGEVQLTPNTPHPFTLNDRVRFGSYMFNTALLQAQVRSDQPKVVQREPVDEVSSAPQAAEVGLPMDAEVGLPMDAPLAPSGTRSAVIGIVVAVIAIATIVVVMVIKWWK